MGELERTVNIGAGTTSRVDGMMLQKTKAALGTVFVLSWDNPKTRIDTNLDTPGGCKVSFQKKTCKTAKSEATLEVDLGAGTGPNTILVKKRETGEYYYTVRAFDSADLQTSGARVDVYSLSKRMTYKVGVNGKLRGDRWHVVSMDGASG